MRSRALRILAVVVAALVVMVIVTRAAVSFYTELLWYDEVGYLDTFWRRIWMVLGVRGAVAVVGAAALLGNLWLVARHLGPVRVRRRYGDLEIAEKVPPRYITMVMAVVGILGGWWLAELQFGEVAALGVMRWLRAESWGLADPMFGRDMAFYVFTLPFLRSLLGFAFLVTLWSAVLVALGHVLGGGIRWDQNRLRMAPAPRLHLAGLVGVLFVLFGVRYWLATYLLAVEGSGVGGSMGYTDVHARLFAYRVLALLALAAGAALVLGAWRNSLWPPVLGVAALLLGGVLLGAVYPAVVQRFQVEPNELAREAPYIAWHLESTRRAFGLDDLRRQRFPYSRDAELEPDRLVGLYGSLPLWDTEPLLRAFNGVQSLFPYYWFPDADFDRYGPAGEERQVVVAVREFNPEGLEPGSRTWQSLHLNPRFIRGRGAVVAPARPTIEGRGTHELWLGNMDPIQTHVLAPDALRLDESSVFFGETMEGYVVVIPGRDGEFTGQPGVDYPRGIPLSSFARVFAFAWRFADETLLFAREVTTDSRLVFRRSVRERVDRIAPFVVWDSDALPVIFQRRIVWLLDGYTVSDSYPLARPAALGRGEVRYLRNSVKGVVDAVTGTVTLYRLDDQDPILATYGRMFPELFRPLASMPAELQRHLRYPELALRIQSDILEEYHLERVEAFYAGENVWERPPQAAPGGGLRPAQPIRALMPLPMQDTVAYLAAIPYIARGRQNMTALLVARNDAARYGELTLLEFPRDLQVDGPGLVQAKIEQDPVIAPELTLLRQRGSNIDMGKMRIIPLDSTVLYVQPFFLSAEQNPIPELWGVVTSDGRNIAIGSSLQASVAGLRREEAAPAPARPGGPGPETWPRHALDLLERAEARLRAGDWAGYGRLIEELRTFLEGVNRPNDLNRQEGAGDRYDGF
jgi:uncharacterized protein